MGFVVDLLDVGNKEVVATPRLGKNKVNELVGRREKEAARRRAIRANVMEDTDAAMASLVHRE